MHPVENKLEIHGTKRVWQEYKECVHSSEKTVMMMMMMIMMMMMMMMYFLYLYLLSTAFATAGLNKKRQNFHSIKTEKKRNEKYYIYI